LDHPGCGPEKIFIWVLECRAAFPIAKDTWASSGMWGEVAISWDGEARQPTRGDAGRAPGGSSFRGGAAAGVGRSLLSGSELSEGLPDRLLDSAIDLFLGETGGPGRLGRRLHVPQKATDGVKGLRGRL